MFAIFITGCDLNSYTPTASMLRSDRNPSGAFIVGESGVRGIYANMDVDASVYTYTTSHESGLEFWAAIATEAGDAGWSTISDETLPDNRKRFLYVTPRTGQQVFHSVEEVRVAFRPKDRSVFVAWVQSDQRELPSAFPKDGPEGDFATRVVWPEFDRAVDSKPAAKNCVSQSGKSGRD